MLAYAVMVVAPGSRWSPESESALSGLAAAPPSAQPHSLSWASTDGTVRVVAHWSDSPRVVAPEVDEHHGVSILSGRPIEVGSGRRLGVYSVLELDAAGAGTLEQDAIGLAGLYESSAVAGGVEVSIYSNRPALAATCASVLSGRPLRKDPIMSAWLAFAGFAATRRTGFEGVQMLGVGAGVRFVPGVGARIETLAPEPWLQPTSGADSASIAAIGDDMAAAVTQVVDSNAGPFRSELTGGQDSRLVLALLRRANRLDDVSLFTRGSPTLPDAVSAAALASHVGVEHSLIPWPSDGGFVARLTRHAARTHGMVSCRDASMPSTWPGITFSGFCSETLRTNRPRHSGDQDFESACDGFAALPFGKAELVRPEFAVAARAETMRDFERAHERGARVDALQDAFDITYRLRHWQATRSQRFADNVFAGYHPPAISVAFGLPWRERAGGRIHSEIIGADAALAEVPYVDASVTPELRDPTPGRFAGLAAEVRRADPGEHSRGRAEAGRIAPGAFDPERNDSFTTGAKRLEALRELVAANPGGPAWDVLDRERIIATVEAGGHLTGRGSLELGGALAGVIWLNDLEATDDVGVW